ncbi:uncharacterized protein LOC135137352 [Zophobas morio]|uniref:uncharacterized protein LOC135137352 n=1 Tax=Zophobas morio TaxID=2755281 RepID=UPI00308392BA
MAHAEKVKRNKLHRQTAINRLNELNTLALASIDHVPWRLEFQMRMESINDIQTEFFKLHNAIIGLIEDVDDAFKVEDEIFVSSSTASTEASTSAKIKLPKIELPTFSGDIITFTPYIEMYQSLIHRSAELTNIEKFNYLLASLKGEALAFIQHIPVTSDNYTVAYNALIQRYQNNRLILNAHWQYLDKAKRVNADNPQDIRDLIDNFAKNVQAIKNFTLPCSQKHHTLLHFDSSKNSPSSSETQPTTTTLISQTPNNISRLHKSSCVSNTVLLSTARVAVLSSRGFPQIFRVLLDSASQSSFITSKAFHKLGLPKKRTSILVHGLGSTSTRTPHGATTFSIRPTDKTFPEIQVDAYILPKICDPLPSTHISSQHWSHIKSNLPLADPEFASPGHIDMLLGADVFSSLFLGNKISGHLGEPDAIQTIFGYVLMGPVTTLRESPIRTFVMTSDGTPSLEETVCEFWELETVPPATIVSPDDALCEKLYSESHYRNEDGRYVVALPFKSPRPIFPTSRELAVQRFLWLEKRLQRNPELYQQYSAFMQEYLDLNHMELADVPSGDSSAFFYIPHHSVLKPDSLTTKLRVVFNGSASLPHQSSLNDHLYVGPKLQRDLISILLTFRLHKVVFVADIKMMYRQILITLEHRDYQRIIWRFSPNEPLADFRLRTVTYGLSSAPYLAIRTLLQLANDAGALFPSAATILQENTYVDDIVTGASSLEAARELKSQLICLLKQGCFELRKWASNEPALLDDLPESHLANQSRSFETDQETSLKILGLQWTPSSDCFHFHTQPFNRLCTKRQILSHLARIFDPLGMLSPVTFILKHLIQQFWILKLDWDDTPPNEIIRLWESFINDLPCFQDLRIPRRIMPDTFLSCQLHGFGDSSEKGYCAVVYFAFILPSAEITTSFVCAKCKVAPLKRLSIPRLELSAAVLLTRLINYICRIYQDLLTFSRICAWSDSQVVLSWINSPPHRWKTFVSNRVSFIQETLPSCHWLYLPSLDNPADIGTRGLLPSKLLQSSLWWAGPAFLRSTTSFPDSVIEPSPLALEEERKPLNVPFGEYCLNVFDVFELIQFQFSLLWQLFVDFLLDAVDVNIYIPTVEPTLLVVVTNFNI